MKNSKTPSSKKITVKDLNARKTVKGGLRRPQKPTRSVIAE